MKISKRNKIIFGAGILLIVIVLIASSYAYWQLVRTQTDENEIATGCFDVTFTEKSAAINLEDAYPITDEEGMEGDPYTFTIKNTCGMYAEYQINLEILPVAENRLSSEFVKAGLNDKVYTLSSTNEVTPTIEEALESYKLISGGLKKNQEKTFDLRLWMDEDTTLEEGSNKFFKSKITVIAVPGEMPERFATSFGSSAADVFESVVSTTDGYIVVGHTAATSKDGGFLTNHKGTLRGGQDAIIVKYDKNGNLVWSNSFGSTAGDAFESVILTTDGFIAVGYTNATSANGDFLTNHKGTLRGGQDAIIVKYDKNGNLVWSNSFGSESWEWFYSVAPTSGGYIVTGYTQATNKTGDFLTNHKGTIRGGQDVLLVKYDANGDLVWSNNFGSTSGEDSYLIASTSDGGFVAVGQTYATSNTGDFLTNHKGTLRGGIDALIVKFDANGDLAWSNSFGSTANDYFNSVTIAPDGGFIVTGYTTATSSTGDFLTNHKGTLRGGYDALLVKYDSGGNLEWSNSFGSTAIEVFSSVTLTTNGDIVVTGSIDATTKEGDLLTNHRGTLRGSNDALVVKYDTSGNLVWSTNFGSTKNDLFLSIASATDGGFIAAGYTVATSKEGDFLTNYKGTLYGGNEGVIVKYDSDGNYFTQEP